MFWVMAAVAAVTLLVILCARAAIRSTENQPAEVEKEAEERVLERGNRRRTSSPLPGTAPMGSRRPPPKLLRAHSRSVRLHGAPGTRPYAGDLLVLKSKSKETCLNRSPTF